MINLYKKHFPYFTLKVINLYNKHFPYFKLNVINLYIRNSSYHGSYIKDCQKFPDISLTFPWHKFKFPWQNQSWKFYEFSKKNTSGPNILASSGWNAKFPDISLTFLQNYIFPWHIIEFPDNSLILKKLNFPDISLTCMNPAHILNSRWLTCTRKNSNILNSRWSTCIWETFPIF